jgi:hypothetical protein
LGRRSDPTEAEGSLTLESQGRVGAALTTTGRIGTTRRSGSGKRDEKVYVRNQRLKAPQASRQLEPGGSGLGRDAHPQRLGGELLGRKQVAALEATLNACGVGVARSQGHSWAPPSLNGQQ